MSGPQHIAWYETAMRETGLEKLIDLQVITAPNGDQAHLTSVHEMLLEMSRGRGKVRRMKAEL